MNPDSEILLKALELTEVEPELFDRAWTAHTQYCPWPKAYGGDMVAQAAAAAMASMDDDKTLHSMHSYFMRPVDIGAEVRYEVEILRDGRGYATRQVRAMQNGKVVYLCLASFHAGGAGAEHAAPMPVGVPDPETLPTSAQVLAAQENTDAVEYWSHGRSFDMRHVPGAVYFEVDGEPVPHQGVWVKAFDKLPDDPDLQKAVLAYVCDYTIIEPILRTLGYAWADSGLVTASLDHAMWFHREAPVDEWLFYAQEAVSAQDERGLGLGRFFDRDGRLVATVVQEAMVRKS